LCSLPSCTTWGLLPKVLVQRITKLSTCYHNRWRLRHGSRSPPETTNVRFVSNQILSDVNGLIFKVDSSLASIHLVPSGLASVWLHCPHRLKLVPEDLSVLRLAMACHTVESDHLIAMAILSRWTSCKVLHTSSLGVSRHDTQP